MKSCIICPATIPSERLFLIGKRCKTCSPECAEQHRINLRRESAKRTKQRS